MIRIKLYVLFLLCWLSSVVYGQISPQSLQRLSEKSNRASMMSTSLPNAQRFVVEAGTYDDNFFYTHTQDTRLTTNAYCPNGWIWSDSPNDVFYRLTLETPMAVLAETMTSLGYNTGFVYFLEEDPITKSLTPIPLMEDFLPGQVASLHIGTYYIVAEGPINNTGVAINDIMTTTITAVPYRYEVPLGSFSTNVQQTLTGDTRRTSSERGDPYRNDIYYRFDLNRPMNLSVTLNSSSDLSNINLYLLDESNKEIISYTGESLFADRLLWGNYYLMIEGEEFEAMFSVDFELEPQDIGIDLGKVSETKTFSETFNTVFSENRFGLSTNEIFYKLQLTQELDIFISNRSSTNSTDAYYATAIYLLNADGKTIRSTENGKTGLTIGSLPAGTYYIVSEGKTQNMSIITEITTTYQKLYPDMDKHNYIMTRTYTQPNGDDSRVKIDYFDGLGRLSNSIHMGASPSGQDIITRKDYDCFGRSSREWLPRVSGNSIGKYLTPTEFEGLSTGIYNNDTHPYSMPVYEASPLNRIVEQYGPGQDWHSQKLSVSTAYKTNISSNAMLNCKLYLVGGTSQKPTLSQNGNYATGQLYVTEVKDEDGNTTYEFKDKLGQVVLTRQMKASVPHDTYYVYDDFGNKCFVLPPRIQDEGITQAKLDELAYQYRYDARNRQIAKKLPGAGWNYYVYDKADRVILSQDSIQRKKGEWLFTIPDAFGRVVLTGTCKDAMDVANKSVKGVYSSTGSYKGYSIQIDGTNRVFSVPPTILSANYYDNYDFRGVAATGIPSAGTEYSAATGYGKQYTGGAKGLLTGTLIAQMNADGAPSSTYLYSVMYYDNRARVIQTKSNNPLTDGIEQEYQAYDFVGNVTQRKHVHQAAGKTAQTEIYKYEYDHAGRLLTTTHKLNSGAEVTLANNAYDELGRLKTNKRNGNSKLKTDYKYNVRSWTKSITNPLFSQTLYYNDKRESGMLNNPAYNGNISGIDWTAFPDNLKRGYDFEYDGLSRLLSAKYLENNIRSPKFSTTYSYDKQGNLLTLSRSGLTTSGEYGLLDDLIFILEGNQLKVVNDLVTDSAYNNGFEFKDQSKLDKEYFYDANGNLIKDLNKNIIDIQYNFLNLPNRIEFEDENSISYLYDATGAKLRVVHSIEGNTTTTDYCGNVIYENGIAKILLIEGGYVSLSDGNYHFYLQDHQGNNRVIVDKNGTVEEVNHYYPFGGTFAESANIQPYKYNGKELDTKNGLNWYDYGARMYDAAIGRWHVVDPLSEKYFNYSSYAYCANNPLRFIDQTGKSYGDFWDKNGKLIGNDGINDNRVYVLKNTSGAKDATKFIEKNSGNSTTFSKNDIAYKNSIEIEGSPSERQKMVNEVSKDNGKGGTNDANNREYGGSVNNGIVTIATPGDVANPKTDSNASILLPVGVSTFHSHPSGQIVDAPPAGTLGGSTSTYSFNQPPSDVDVSNAGNNTHYVFGRSTGKVYIYNSSGIQATIPMKYFVTPKIK